MHDKNASATVRYFSSILREKQFKNEHAARYGLAHALMKNGQYAEAREQVEKLLAAYPEKIPFVLLKARLDLLQNRYPDARKTLEHALKLYPHNVPVTHALADMFMQKGDYKNAIIILREQSRYQPNSPDIFKMLADAEGKSGQTYRARQSLAEYYYLNGDTQTAIEHLRYALKEKNIDFYRSSQIEARLHQLEQEHASERAR